MRDTNRFNSLDSGSVPGVLRRGMRTILIWMGVFAAIAVCVNVLMPPVYRATVRLEIRKPPDRSPLTGQSFSSPAFQSENMSMITAAERIKDRMLLGQIATEFSPQGWIRTLPSSLPGDNAMSSRFQWAGVASAKAMSPSNGGTLQKSALEAQVDWLQTIVAVEPIPDTRLVDVKVEHRDPQAARSIADRLAQRFVEDQGRQAADADTSGLQSITTQLDRMRQSFDSRNSDPGLARLEGPAVLQSRIRTLSDAAVALNSECMKVHADRVELQARLQRIAMSDPGSLDIGATTPGDAALAGLQRDLENCRVQLAAAREVYKSKHPKLVSLESQYAALQTAFRAEQQRASGRMKEEDAVLAARERATLESRDQNDRALAQVEQQYDRSAAYHGEMKAQQDLYGMLVAKVQQSRVEELLKARPVEIVNAATLAPKPVRPRKVLNLAVCLMTGLLFGSGQVLVRHSTRHTVRTPADAEALLEIPVLGVIPKRD